MKEGYIVKSAAFAPEDELAQISRFARRTLREEEIYLFSVVLCDNDVDRDFERFTSHALAELSAMYVGKTGIFDHSMKGSDQVARIYDCKVERVEGRLTKTGEPYERLVAKAYMPRTAGNADLILELDAGIKKEVSVGCAVAKATCSVCGADRKTGCRHTKGRRYGPKGEAKLCCTELDDPTDAYEWSFVAVPAQREAGVVKAFHPNTEGTYTSEEIIKRLSIGEEITLCAAECRALLGGMDELRQLAEVGKASREELKKQVVRLSGIVQPEIPAGVMDAVAQRMSASELKAFQKAFEAKVGTILPVKPQLAPRGRDKEEKGNLEFKI